MLTGKKFLPELISGPFHHGLVIVFSMAMAVPVIAALASLLRGGRYVHEEGVSPVTPPVATPSQAGVAAQADGAAAGNGSGLGNGAAAGKSSKIPSSDVRAEDSRATP